MSEEQLEEIEVLRSIYDEKLTGMSYSSSAWFSLVGIVLSEVPIRLRISGISGYGVGKHCLTLRLFDCVGLDLEVEFSSTYPQELPKFFILPTSGKLSDSEALRKYVIDEAERSLGMAMVFTLVTAIEAWLSENMKPVTTSLTLNPVKSTKEQESHVVVANLML